MTNFSHPQHKSECHKELPLGVYLVERKGAGKKGWGYKEKMQSEHLTSKQKIFVPNANISRILYTDDV
jgi:hypothetical protein